MKQDKEGNRDRSTWNGQSLRRLKEVRSRTLVKQVEPIVNAGERAMS